MLLYDHNRTEKIVERLCKAEGIVRFVTIATSILLFALVGISTATVFGSAGDRLIGGVTGAIIGFGVGNFSMVLLSAVIEWMCQMLIAQGEIVEAAKRSRKV